jgi:outer membrane protein OmpA-like peptidoglycan-associated protein
MLTEEHPRLLQKKPDERYDSLIAVLLSFAMVAGVWHYAVKPDAKPVLRSADLEITPLRPIQTWAADVASQAITCPVKTQTAEMTAALPTALLATQPVDTTSDAVRKLPHVVLQTVKRPVALKPHVVPVKPKVKPAAAIAAPIAATVAPPAKVVVEAPPPPIKIVEPVKVAPVVASPAPEIAPGVIVRESFEFATASARLPQSATERLLEIAALLKNDTRILKIVGYTDNIGSPQDNHILSLKRAKAVRRFLVNAGIPWTQLTVDGAGQDNPIADNATEEGRSRNRRIEIAEQS